MELIFDLEHIFTLQLHDISYGSGMGSFSYFLFEAFGYKLQHYEKSVDPNFFKIQISRVTVANIYFCTHLPFSI